MLRKKSPSKRRLLQLLPRNQSQLPQEVMTKTQKVATQMKVASPMRQAAQELQVAKRRRTRGRESEYVESLSKEELGEAV